MSADLMTTPSHTTLGDGRLRRRASLQLATVVAMWWALAAWGQGLTTADVVSLEVARAEFEAGR